jgi:hypothetical protein
MMDAPVDAIDDEAETLAEFVGQPLVDDPTDDWRRGLFAVEGIAFERTLLTARRQSAVDDGALSYRLEQVLETYYLLTLNERMGLSLDYQHISNAAYNAARGPVSVIGMRLHVQFERALAASQRAAMHKRRFHFSPALSSTSRSRRLRADLRS